MMFLFAFKLLAELQELFFIRFTRIDYSCCCAWQTIWNEYIDDCENTNVKCIYLHKPIAIYISFFGYMKSSGCNFFLLAYLLLLVDMAMGNSYAGEFFATRRCLVLNLNLVSARVTSASSSIFTHLNIYLAKFSAVKIASHSIWA